MTEFSGSERTVAGYLMAEVLERQPRGGARPAAAHVRPGAGQRAARRRPDRQHGLGADPAAARGRERVRRLARRRTIVVPLPPPASPTCCTSSCGGRPRRLIDSLHRAAARVVRGARLRGRGDPARAGRGRLAPRRPPACRQRPSASSSTAARRPPRAARRLPGRRARQAMRSWRSRSPRAGSTRACSTRAPHTSPPRSGWPTPCRPSGGGCFDLQLAGARGSALACQRGDLATARGGDAGHGGAARGAAARRAGAAATTCAPPR